MSTNSLKLPDAIAAMANGIQRLANSIERDNTQVVQLSAKLCHDRDELIARRKVLEAMQDLDAFYKIEGKDQTIRFLIPSGDN